MQINSVLSEICSQHRGIGSTDQCYAVLYSFVRAFGAKRVVEVGTHQAASTIAICQAVLDNKEIPQVWTIDNWSQPPGSEKMARDHLAKAGFENYVTMVRGNSDKVLPVLFSEIGAVDLVFIDGCHSPDAVQKDIDACMSYSNRLVMHDTPAMNSYLYKLRGMGWIVTVFPTRFLEGGGAFVGISLAVKE